MSRLPARIHDPELAEILRQALGRGVFAPPEASRVLRALAGDSQGAFAARLGMNAKVIKALESGKGNPRYASLEKIAAAFGLRVAFVEPRDGIELLSPDARSKDEYRRRQADAEALASGEISEAALHERNAMKVDDVDFDLPILE